MEKDQNIASTLSWWEITMQSLSGTDAYFPSDIFKPKNTEWKYIIPGMNSRHVKKVYSSFLLSSFLLITEF